MLGQALPTFSPATFAVGAGSAVLIIAETLAAELAGMLIAVVLASVFARLFRLPIETIGSHFDQLSDGAEHEVAGLQFSNKVAECVECLARRLLRWFAGSARGDLSTGVVRARLRRKGLSRFGERSIRIRTAVRGGELGQANEPL